MKRIYSMLLFAVAISFSVKAEQGGTLTGQVLDAVTGIPLIGANVYLEGTTIGSATDLDGNFKINNIPEGNYTVISSLLSYKTVKKNEILIQPGKTVSVVFRMAENVEILDQVSVVAERITHTENALMMEIKSSKQIVNGVSNEQILKSQDRTASEVAKRIPGVVIQDNRFIMIRGLSERYNHVSLNSSPAPSMESDKNAFSFDVIPSSLLDRFLIYKTASYDISSEFAGGAIKIFTKNIPDENMTSVSIGTSYRNGTTFENFYRDVPGKTDWLGFDDGIRSLPESFPDNLNFISSNEEREQLNHMLNNRWVAERINAIPDFRFNTVVARRFKWNTIQMGNITSLSYSNSFEKTVAEQYNYNAYDLQNQTSDTIYKYNDTYYSQSVKINLMSNFFAQLSAKHRIEFKNFFSQSGLNKTTVREGLNFESGYEMRNYAYYYQQRSIYSGQLSGTHSYHADKSELTWNAGFSMTASEEPDYRRVRSVRDINLVGSDEPFSVVIAPTASILDAGRYFSTLNEELYSGSAEFTHNPTCKNPHIKVQLKAGATAEYKLRDFSARWMSYKKAKSSQFDDSLLWLPLDQIFSQENINSETGFKLEEGTNPTDSYSAEKALAAAYTGGDISIGDKLNITTGLRAEYSLIGLQSRDYGSNLITVRNKKIDLLPSMNVSYNITEKHLIRIAYATTLNRPEFRELAPFAFYDFSFNNVLYGNENLLQATIHNYDLRYEIYPNSGEIISAGIFHKHFINPIEMYFVPGSGSGGTRNFTFDNASYANSIGAEIEVRKSLNGLFNESSLLNNFSLVLNSAFIKSSVELGDKASGQETSRPMLGQAPYIINGGIYFDSEKHAIQASVMYNIIGPRVYVVGSYGTPDIYEMPKHSVDAAVSKKFNEKIQVKISAQDILNSYYSLMQDSNTDGKINSIDERIMRYQKGTYFSASLGITL